MNYTEGTMILSAEDEEMLAYHQELRRLQGQIMIYKRNFNDFYFIFLTIITFIMQLGFTFMEVGLVRSKNTTNILLKCTLDAFVGCTSFWLFGYAMAWGEGNSFVGWDNFALTGIPDSSVSLALYQLIFANTASTIVSGAVAERLNLPCYFVYGVLLTGIAYPIVSRWGWYDHGWLKVMGFKDFAGSGLVHMFSGACAVIASYIIGPRAGRFGPNGHHMAGHSLPMVGVGIMVLIFGFLGFNASSELSVSEPRDGKAIIVATLNTFLACCFGAMSTLLINRYKEGHWSYVAFANGAVAGLAAVCAGCDALEFWGAAVTGVIAGFAFTFGRSLLDHWKIDDPIDAFPIHFCGGSTGVLTAPFLVADGILLNWNAHGFAMLGCNLLGYLTINAWAFVWMVPMFLILKRAGVLRIPPEMEETGMDVIKHNEPAYSYAAWKEDFARQPPSRQDGRIGCGTSDESNWTMRRRMSIFLRVAVRTQVDDPVSRNPRSEHSVTNAGRATTRV